MQGKWVVEQKDSLVLNDSDNNTIIPTAEEIFLSEFKNKSQIRNIQVLKPSIDIESLSFSKYPLELKLQLKPYTDNENIFITANIVVDFKGEYKQIVGLIDSGIDHIIINNTWYPFVRGTMDEIKEVLKKSDVKDLGRISLQQYLSIKKQENPVVIDNLQEVSLDKSQFISSMNIEIPSFVGNLYPYQNQGYRWLKMIVNENAGCILADEMGLGKTAQIIAVLASESKDATNPSLVVAPVSLLENWRREVQKFAPSLKVKVHQGNHRTGFYTEFTKFDVVVTSYETVLRDLSLFQMLNWNIVVADEAQAIKNPKAKRAIAIKQIDRKATIAVTGTPVENKLTDLWSITDFVFPGYLGELKQFEETFPDEIDSAEQLEPLVSPILLRRRVKDVAGDLPKRIDIPQVLKLSEGEANLYDNLRMQIIEEYGKQASLVSLIKLRMYCTHPFLQVPSEEREPTLFGKYIRLVEILEEIISNQEKVIIFTSYTEMSDIFVSDLTNRFGIHCDYIDGRVDVSERQPKIDKFSGINGSAILILNPRAAGAGLNITAANHVIHYNLEWNPAIEDQASARAHRRGQTRPVTVYRLFYADTVEDAINNRLERKREISEAAVIGTDGQRSDNTDIIDALLKSPMT
ncbi:DEAD/DEAH box helicase [Metabacillus niabensis]|uniref:DEAD/DEAH box helicase n=1 Tax=Metabacillus niabensis TaxID=324854 RepID=UPI001CFAD860|nr:DEAD/DEAH box helicase [Metabacillus niabensis]